MARDSTQIKNNLIDDLVSSTSLIANHHVDNYLIEPEELDTHDDVDEFRISLYQGIRRSNLVVDGLSVYDTIQEYIIQIYIQSHRLRGSEQGYAELYDDLQDDIFDWIITLGDNNRIYDVTGGKLRVPKPEEDVFFSDQEEPFPAGISTYTRFHFQSIRKTS